MNPKEKVKVFDLEISLIKNDQIKEFAIRATELLPDYFFIIPASTSKKYHPNFASGDGGLVRHTQAAVRLAYEMFRMEIFNYFTSNEKDLILASLLLHDGKKAGYNGVHTVTEHPILMGKFLRNSKILSDIIPEEWLNIICQNIERHMGAWTKDYKTGKEILEKPQNKMNNFVHICDYIVSRKMMEIDLDAKLS